TTARQRTSNDRTLGDHCCRRWCRDEPRRMVRNAYSAPQERAIQLVRGRDRCGRFPGDVAMEMEHHSCDPGQRTARTDLRARWFPLKIEPFAVQPKSYPTGFNRPHSAS